MRAQGRPTGAHRSAQHEGTQGHAAPALRMAALTGAAVAAAVAVWWLGSSRLALEDGGDASRPAAQALLALWLVRAMVLALLSLRVAAVAGWRAGARAGLVMLAPAWPVLALVWSASTAPLLPVLLAVLALLVATAPVSLVGLALHKLFRQPPMAEAAATLAGVALASGLWSTRGLWATAWLA